MKIFDSNKPMGKFAFEALVDGFTHDQLKLIEDKKMIQGVSFKVKDDETIVVSVSYHKNVDGD